jgi:CRISPR-associated protein Cas2
MPDRPQLRLIVYDIANDRRRRKVAALLEKRAARVQESVFEARLSQAQLTRLRHRLDAVLAPEDSLRIYTVPDAALTRCHIQGGPMLADGARYWLI